MTIPFVSNYDFFKNVKRIEDINNHSGSELEEIIFEFVARASRVCEWITYCYIETRGTFCLLHTELSQ